MSKKKQPLQWQVFTPGTRVEFDYVNHRGIREHREATFLGIDYGFNEWYPEPPQFFLRCEAHDRDGAERSFAISKIENISKVDMSW